MADILLSFGLETGAVASKKIHDDLNKIIESVNKNPPKILVGLQTDPAAQSKFKKEIENIINSMGLAANRSSKGKKSTVKVLTQDSIEYYKALEQVRNQIIRLRKAEQNMSAADGGVSDSMYKDIGKAIKMFEALEIQLMQGSTSTEDFQRRMSELKSTFAELHMYIQAFGEDYSNDLLSGKKLDKAQKSLSDASKKIANMKKKYGDLDWTDPSTGQSTKLSSMFDGAQAKINSLSQALSSGTVRTETFNNALAQTYAWISKIDAKVTGDDLLSGSSLTNAKKDLFELNKRITKLKQNYGNLSGFDNNNPASTISDIIDDSSSGAQAKIDNMLQKLENGSVTIREFANAVAEIRLQLSSLEAFGGATDSFIPGSTKQNNMANSFEKMADDIDKYLESVSAAKKTKPYENLKKLSNEARQYASNIRDCSTFQSEANDKMTVFSGDLKQYKKDLEATGKAHKSLADRVGSLATKFASWLTISQVIMAAFTAMKRMVSTAIEVDTAMTELKKVTNETDSTYNKFLDNAANRAKKVGATLTDVVNASASFARLGYDIDDAANLADTAIVYKNVADDIDTIDEASTSIISTMQAFGVEAGDAMSIVDKFNEVSNNFAITSGGLGEALQRSASAMKSAGNTLDETIALVTAANTVVQNPESVGTTLKTISMYLRAAKTEAEEAGESTDGMASSTSELRKELLALTGEKVDIQLDENTFKSTYQILKELAEVWDELTDVSQANILEMIGGKRNANVTSALIEQFGLVEDVLETSENSTGSALAENEKYLESIEGHISKFKAAFEAMSETAMNSDLIKGAIDIGTWFLNAANAVFTLVDALGGLDNILKAIMAYKAVDVLGDVLGGKSGFGELIGNVNEIIHIIPWMKDFNIENSMSKSTKSVLKFSKAYNKAFNANRAIGLNVMTSSFNAFGDTTKKALKSIPAPKLALGGLALGIGVITTAYEIYNNVQNERISDAQKDAEMFEKQTSAMDSYKKEVESLKNSLDFGVLSAENEYKARARLLEIQNEIVNSYGAEASALNLLSASAEEAGNAIDNVTSASAQRYLAENAKIIKSATNRMNAGQSFETSFSRLGGSKSALESVRKLVAEIDGVRLVENGLGGYALTVTGNANEAREAIEKLKPELEELSKNYTLQGIDLGISGWMSSLDSAYSRIQKYVEGYEEVYEQALKMKIASGYDKYKSGENKGKDVTYNSILKDMTDAQLEYNDAVTGSFETEEERAASYQKGIDAMNAMKEQLDSIEFTDPAVKEYFENMIKDMEADMAEKQLYIDIVARFKGEGNESDSFDGILDTAGDILKGDALSAFKGEDGLIDGFKILDEAVKIESLGDTTEGLTDAQEAVKQLMDACAASGTDLETFLFTLSQAGIISSSMADSMNTVSSAVSGHATTLSSIKKEQSALTAALKEQGGTGTLTFETYKALIAESEDYAACLEYENGAMRLNAEAAGTMLEAKTLAEALNLEAKIEKETAQFNANAKTINRLSGEYDRLVDKESDHAKSLKKQIDSLKDSQIEIQKSIQQYSILRSELLNMNSAYYKWQLAQEMPETGEMYDSLKTALSQIKDGLKTGKTGTLKYQTAVDMLVTLDDPSPKQVQGYMKKLNRYITDNSSGAKNFINDMINKGLMESSTGGRATWKDAWLKDADMTIDEICKIMEITPTMAKAIFGELEEYHFNFQWTEDDFNKAILEEDLKKIEDEVEKYKKAIADNPTIAPEVDSSALDDYVNRMNAAIDKLKALGPDASSYDLKPIKEEIEALLSEGFKLGIDLESLGFTEDYFSSLGLNVQTADVQAQLTAVATTLDGIAEKVTAIAASAIGELGAPAAVSALSTVHSKLQEINSFKINDKTFSVTAVLSGITSQILGSSDGGNASARGTMSARGGRTLVGELGRELVVSNGKYYTVGDKGAEFVNLKKGDIVFNHIDTERILKKKTKTNSGQAFATGTEEHIAYKKWLAMSPAEREAAILAEDTASIDSAADIFAGLDQTDKDNNVAWQNYLSPNGNRNGGKTDLSISTGGPGSKAAKNNFEKQYKEHQHLLAMDQEETAEYLDWLENAYKEAFEEGSDEYRKYAEEVYKGRQDLFKDMLGDKEHLIFMLEANDADATTIINNYQSLIQSVEAELAKAYAAGLDDNDDYVQELQKKLIGYKDEVKSINEDIEKDAKDSYEDMIEYRIDMLKQELEDEKESLNERINSLQDFYSKQKDMLRDVYDEEKYQEEQAEKRKAVSDIEAELEMLKRDDSASAQRRRLELEEELAEAKKDLANFEKEHALEMAEGMLDDQLELQENRLNDKIDEVDEKLGDQKGLRDQAIADLQNGDADLYKAMVEYNNVHGDGNENTIKTMWEEAYIAMQKYFELYGQYYEGMQIQNVTGYIPIPTGQGYASGTSKATAGLHEIEEKGAEYIFESSNGRRYRMFTGNEKVLTASATDFLYKFANSGGKVLENMISGTRNSLPNNAASNNQIFKIKTGDIIIQGNATERTVSEIRRAQRESVDFMLKEFGRLQNR